MFSLPHFGLQDLDKWWQGLYFKDPPKYTGSSTPTGGASHPRQVCGKATHQSLRIVGGLGIGMTVCLVKSKLFQNPRKIGEAMAQVWDEAL